MTSAGMVINAKSYSDVWLMFFFQRKKMHNLSEKDKL